MQVHLLPLFFIIWFLTPWIIQFSKSFNKYLRFCTLSLLVTFIVVNLCSGYFIYNDHKNLLIRDFAHSPSKLKASVDAVRETFTDSFIITIFLFVKPRFSKQCLLVQNK